MTTTTDPLADRLQRRLGQLAERSLQRRLRTLDAVGRIVRAGSRDLVNLASNDYLALARHRRLVDAVARAAHDLGVGGGASRLVSGHTRAHQQLEERFAAFKHAQAALLLPTGYMANLAVLTTLAERGDAILLDKLTHASLIDAAHATPALVRTFRHLDYDQLADRLAKLRTRLSAEARIFLVTDSIFSMDGDAADLPALCDLADRFGCVTVVDEAHATGVFGPNGEGLAAAQGVADRIHVTISTASKGLGSLGGIVTSSRLVIDALINGARPLIYTTAPPPPQVAAIDAALDVVRDEPHRRARVLELTRRLRDALDVPGPSPIVPLIAGSADAALALAARLEEAGFVAVAIRPPTVAPETARVRLSLRADLTDDDLTRLIAALR